MPGPPRKTVGRQRRNKPRPPPPPVCQWCRNRWGKLTLEGVPICPECWPKATCQRCHQRAITKHLQDTETGKLLGRYCDTCADEALARYNDQQPEGDQI